MTASLSPREATILLCGYGWFSGIPEGETNNAELIARALDGETIEARDDGGRLLARGHVRSLVVPVVWDGAFPSVEAAIRTHRPDIVLAMGTDARAFSLRPEPYAVNWQRGTDALPDDPARQTTLDGPILPGGPDALRSTLPCEAMTVAILRAGIPAQLGGLLPPQEGIPLPAQATTGTYLCNKMAYLLSHLAAGTGLLAGFMHVPTQYAYAVARRLRRLGETAGEEHDAALQKPISGMPLEAMIAGTRAALAACLAHLG